MGPLLDTGCEDDRHADDRLRAEPVIWFGSTRADGAPHLVPVWFLWDDPTVLVFSMPDTRKCRNIARQDRVALALDTAASGQDVVRLEGRARLVGPDQAEVVRREPAFAAKYAALLPPGAFPGWRDTFSQPILIEVTRAVHWVRGQNGLAYRSVPGRRERR